MDKRLVKDSLGWGFILWLIGYILGIALVFQDSIYVGWIIMPIGVLMTLWVLFRKVKGGDFKRYLVLAVVWSVIAVVFDYVFIVKALSPADGYYKVDVYIYYLLTFVMPLIVGGWKKSSSSVKTA